MKTFIHKYGFTTGVTLDKTELADDVITVRGGAGENTSIDGGIMNGSIIIALPSL